VTIPIEHPPKRDQVIKIDAPRMARQLGLELKVPTGFPEHALPPSHLLLDGAARMRPGRLFTRKALSIGAQSA
jgi:hypothetical protein